MTAARRQDGKTAGWCRSAGRALAMLVPLGVLPSWRLEAQAITVVATRAFRPTAVMAPHLGYVVVVDSAAGGLVLSDLTIPPVTFTGTVTIEGIQPGARAPETPAFADTVRFEGDGRVTLLVADRAGRPPLVVETFGSRSAAAGATGRP